MFASALKGLMSKQARSPALEGVSAYPEVLQIESMIRSYKPWWERGRMRIHLYCYSQSFPAMDINEEPRQTFWFRKIRTAISYYFASGISNFWSVYVAYHPDSYTMVTGHPEFGMLRRAFTLKNKRNNSGDVGRLWTFILNIKQVLEEEIEGEGDFAELGVWRGNTARVLAHYARLSDRKVFLFDTFDGFDSRDMVAIDGTKKKAFSDTSEALVARVLGEDGVCCEIVKGWFPESLGPSHSERRYAVVSLDCDLYEPMRAGLEFFYPLMPKGGLLLIHDYNNPAWGGVKKAVDEFCRESGESIVAIGDKSGSVVIKKAGCFVN